ncbi:hypothetical protein ACS0TY_025483 [Phlomoides rotata]
MYDYVTIEAPLSESSPIVVSDSEMSNCWVINERCGDDYSKIWGCFKDTISPLLRQQTVEAYLRWIPSAKCLLK